MGFLDFFKKIGNKDTWEKKDKPATDIKAKRDGESFMPGAGHYKMMHEIVPGTNLTVYEYYLQGKRPSKINKPESIQVAESRNPIAASMPVPVSAVPAVAKVGSGFIDDLKVIASKKYAPNLLGRGVSYGYIRKHGASMAGAGVYSQSKTFLDQVADTKKKLNDTGSDAYKSWEESAKKTKGKFANAMREIQARPGYKPPPPGVLKIAPAPAQAPTEAPTGSGIGWDWKRGITY